MSRVLSLRPSYYEALKRLTLELVGINLGANHPFLIETRLASLARKEGFEDLNALVNELFSRGQSRLAIKVVSALLQRDTHFFPDQLAITQFRSALLPNLIELFPDHPIRVLSFGCSSGQEPYSYAIVLNKLRKTYPNLRFKVTGVDYPSPALDRAARGHYTHFEVQRGLSIRDLITYFDRHGEDWVAKPQLQDLVDFKEAHLLSNLDDLGKYHLAIFRNSMGHYSSAARVRVMRGLSSVVEPQGYLSLSSKEETSQSIFGFDAVEGLNGVYSKPKAIEEEVEDSVDDDVVYADPVEYQPQQKTPASRGAS